MLPVAMARSFSNDSAMLCTSGFVGPMGQNERQRYVSSSSSDGGNGGKVAVYNYRLVFIYLCKQ